MMIGELPLLGEYSIMGVLLMVIVWFIYAIITGRLVPRKTLEDQKETTSTFEAAWKTERERADQFSGMVTDLKVVGENMEKVLNSLPVPDSGGDET